MALAEYLYEEIKKRNVSKSQFAEEMGIKPTELNRILTKDSNKKTPSEAVFNKLAQNLGLSRDELIKICFDEGTSLIYGSYPELEKKIKTLSVNKIVKDIMENDIKNSIPKESRGTEEQWKNIIQNFPDICCFFFNVEEERIIGDWSFIALNEDQKKEITTSGSIDDTKLSYDTADPLTLPGDYDIYIYNMSFIPSHNTAKNVSIMLESFSSKLYELAQNNVWIQKVYMKTLNPKDSRVITALGFSPVENSKDLFVLTDFPNGLQNFPNKEKLFEIYKSKRKLEHEE